MSPDGQGGNDLSNRLRTYLSLLLAATIVLAAAPAHAVSSAQKMAEARRVKAQVEALDDRVEIAAEKYNIANAKHAKLLKERQRAAARVKKAEKRLDQLQTHLGTRANDMYRTGRMGFVDVLLGAESFEELATTWDILKDLNESDAGHISEMKDARAEAKAAHADYSAKEKEAARQLAVKAATKKSITAQLAERKRKLAGVEAEVRALQAQEEAARAARARSWASSDGGGRTFPPPTRAPRSELVSIARRYLGAPYRWAADGPNSFDCSGFTMFVYRQVGVSLPHSSRAQIHEGQRVSRGDLAAGDLVFFGSPIHHVGLYIGGGMMIHAPHSGDVVRIASINRSNYAGACRP